ncbi:MAG: molybdopterin-dependent oxidoreductase [Bacteroidetes bacterium]|nr:molybdopterin-dependent oxidoreductase [Bacteroidota bacterium]
MGKPFNYYSFGMAVSEVLVDTLTGYVKIYAQTYYTMSVIRSMSE